MGPDPNAPWPLCLLLSLAPPESLASPPRSDSPDLVRGAGADLACGTISVEELLWQENCFKKFSREWNVLIWLTFSQIRIRPCGAVRLAGDKNPISFPSIFVETVMRLQLLLLHTAGMHSREELHPTSAVTDVLYHYSWMFLLGLKQRKQCLWFSWTEVRKHKKLSHLSLILTCSVLISLLGWCNYSTRGIDHFH